MSRLISMKTLDCTVSQFKASSQFLSKHTTLSQPCLQCVRYYRPRKPFWLPIAKSKRFKIPVKPVVPEAERLEFTRLTNVYNTNMKSLREYFKEQLASQTTSPEVIQERKQKEIEQHEWCIKENEKWNIEVAKLREGRLDNEAIIREENILQKILTHEKMQQEMLDEINALVRREKEASKTFITPENINEAIEVALKNTVDHNFCIDVEGNIHEGRYGKPPPPASAGRKLMTPKTPQDENSSEMQASN